MGRSFSGRYRIHHDFYVSHSIGQDTTAEGIVREGYGSACDKEALRFPTCYHHVNFFPKHFQDLCCLTFDFIFLNWNYDRSWKVFHFLSPLSASLKFMRKECRSGPDEKRLSRTRFTMRCSEITCFWSIKLILIQVRFILSDWNQLCGTFVSTSHLQWRGANEVDLQRNIDTLRGHMHAPLRRLLNNPFPCLGHLCTVLKFVFRRKCFHY